MVSFWAVKPAVLGGMRHFQWQGLPLRQVQLTIGRTDSEHFRSQALNSFLAMEAPQSTLGGLDLTTANRQSAEDNGHLIMHWDAWELVNAVLDRGNAR
jgi:hypothetical protein